MAAERKTIWAAFGLVETAPADHVRTAFESMLDEEMTPGEKEQKRQRRDNERLEGAGRFAIRSALGLPSDASEVAVVEKIKALVAGAGRDKPPAAELAEDDDPRATLRELADARAAAKKIGFAQALAEVRAEQKELAEAADEFYQL